MNKLFKIFFTAIVFSALTFCKQSYAQQNHFIYIQADDKQPFTVNVNGKAYASSEIGYVIIPKLTDGKYQLNVNFPDNKYPDQQFNCLVNKTDVGYALKNYQEKGWGLFNLQTLDITMAGAPVADVPKDTVNPNAFSEMLSDVVNDTTLKKAAVELQMAKNQKEVPPVVKDTVAKQVAAPTLNDSLIAQQKQIVKDSAGSKTSIMKIAEHTTKAGTSMIFLDPSSGDTIKIFLPNTELKNAQAKVQEKNADSPVAMNNAPADTSQQVAAKNPIDTSKEIAVNNPIDITNKQTAINNANDTSASANVARVDTSVTDNAVNVADTSATKNANNTAINNNTPDVAAVSQDTQPKEEIKNDNPLPDTTATTKKEPNNPFYTGEKKKDTANNVVANDGNNNQTVVQKTETVTEHPVTTGAFKIDCKKMFADNDLDKLRKKMVSSGSDDKMIQTAKKYFEDKCLTTAQVKSLGALLLTDEGRYNFFDAAYRNVYDISAFPSLESQLIDPYYKKRFRAMLR